MRDRDGAAVAIRADRTRTIRTRADGSRLVTARFRRPALFAVGMVLIIGGMAMIATSIASAIEPDCFSTECAGLSDQSQKRAAIIGPIGGALTLGGAGLLWAGWPPSLRAEPPAAHPEL